MPSSSPQASPAETSCLLLIEDDPEVRTGLEDYFSFAGYKVSSVETGADALPAIRSETPDLIILDLRLPRKDGFEVLRELRKDGEDVPVFVLTALHKGAHRQRCLELGADGYFTKPFDIKKLAGRVAEALGPKAQKRIGDG